MIEVESSAFTESSPSMRGRAGRAPVLMKMLSAVNVRVPPALSLISTVLGPVKCASPKMSSTFSAFSSRRCIPCAEVVHDCLLAPVDLRHVNTDGPAVNAIVRRAGPGKRFAPGDHRLRRCAAHIDTGAADMFTLYERLFFAQPWRVQWQAAFPPVLTLSRWHRSEFPRLLPQRTRANVTEYHPRSSVHVCSTSKPPSLRRMRMAGIRELVAVLGMNAFAFREIDIKVCRSDANSLIPQYSQDASRCAISQDSRKRDGGTTRHQNQRPALD